jgi:hypothetical protein
MSALMSRLTDDVNYFIRLFGEDAATKGADRHD